MNLQLRKQRNNICVHFWSNDHINLHCTSYPDTKITICGTFIINMYDTGAHSIPSKPVCVVSTEQFELYVIARWLQSSLFWTRCYESCATATLIVVWSSPFYCSTVSLAMLRRSFSPLRSSKLPVLLHLQFERSQSWNGNCSHMVWEVLEAFLPAWSCNVDVELLRNSFDFEISAELFVLLFL